jgi:hypothetical protein
MVHRPIDATCDARMMRDAIYQGEGVHVQYVVERQEYCTFDHGIR